MCLHSLFFSILYAYSNNDNYLFYVYNWSFTYGYITNEILKCVACKFEQTSVRVFSALRYIKYSLNEEYCRFLSGSCVVS